MELEYKADHAELEKKDAEAYAAEPSGGTVPTWLAVGTIVLVLITGPLLKMKASNKPAAAATPKAAPKAKAKAVPAKAVSVAAPPKAVPAKAAAKAVVPAAKAGKAAAKATSSSKGSGKGKLQAPEVSFKQLKAILKLQAVARGWKARQDVHPSGPKEKVRTLNEGEQIAVSIQNISMKNIPEVNFMGGVDPFLEVQCGFSKDPDAKGRTSASSEKTDRTEVLSGSNPKFEKTMDLPRVFNKPDQFLNFLIFDSGTAEDTFIGSKSLSVNKLLEGITVFDLQGPPKAIEQELIFTSEYSTKKDIKAKFDVIICEAMKFVFDIKQGEKFPEVDNFGGIDSFIEIRATRSDVKSDFLVDDPKCIWSGRTQVHTDTIAPKYNQEIKATLPADPTLKIQIILWDSNAPMADFPVAHHIMEISEEICHKQNLAPLDHVIKFQKIPGQTPLKGTEKASLKFSLQTSLAEPGVPPPPPPPKAAPKATPTVPKAKAGQAKAASKATAKPKGGPGTAAKGADLIFLAKCQKFGHNATPVMTIFVALSGCTRSGKSILAKMLEEHLDDVKVVHQDDFWYRSVSVDVNGQSRRSQEEPGCTNFNRLLQCVKDVAENHKIVIVEGFQVLHDPKSFASTGCGGFSLAGAFALCTDISGTFGLLGTSTSSSTRHG
eukprot:symbB.v1.2.009602.t1/scaffold613.1/size180894/10